MLSITAAQAALCFVVVCFGRVAGDRSGEERDERDDGETCFSSGVENDAEVDGFCGEANCLGFG